MDQKRAELVATRNAAWAKVNAVLDQNGSQVTPEYQEAWAAWEAAAHAVLDHDQAKIQERQGRPDG